MSTTESVMSGHQHQDASKMLKIGEREITDLRPAQDA